MLPILVTGGTGTLGRVLVQQLVHSDLPTRVLSRRADGDFPAGVDLVTGDLVTGAGIGRAVTDVGAVVHCATNYRHPLDDVHGIKRLIAAMSREGERRGSAPHLIYVSIVGVDRIPVKMYRYKAGIEGLVERSFLPWTIQRSTQFHDVIKTGLKFASRLPVLPLPSGTDFQPIDTADVARRLEELAVGAPLGRVRDIGGPRVHTIQDLARTYLRVAGKQRRLVPVWLPGRVFAGYRHGWQLAPDHPFGTLTFEQFLLRTGPG